MYDIDWQSSFTGAWFFVVGGLVILGALVMTVVRISRSSTARIAAHARAVKDAEDAAPRCACGAYATHPLPFLTWDRTGIGAWLRALHGAPPKYTLRVDNMRPTELCSLHARVADATLIGWIFGVRTRYAELNQKVATEAAAFEQEGLAKAIADSLTDAQKRASKRPTAVITRLARNGTDSTESS